MKRIFVSALLVFAVGLTTVFAADEVGISTKVKESFKKEFAGANPVRWNNLGDYQMVIFVLNDHLTEAYFNSETGELAGTARYMLFDQLPLTIMRSYDKSFARADFISALEVANDEETFYRIIVEKQNKRYSVKINASGNLLGITKMRK